jgi:hypothetical protein
MSNHYKKLFPEFSEFEPTDEERDGSCYWYINDYKTRSIALLLMAEMCND